MSVGTYLQLWTYDSKKGALRLQTSNDAFTDYCKLHTRSEASNVDCDRPMNDAVACADANGGAVLYSIPWDRDRGRLPGELKVVRSLFAQENYTPELNLVACAQSRHRAFSCLALSQPMQQPTDPYTTLEQASYLLQATSGGP